MNSLLKFSRLVDACSDLIGKVLFWFILAAVFISAGPTDGWPSAKATISAVSHSVLTRRGTPPV